MVATRCLVRYKCLNLRAAQHSCREKFGVQHLHSAFRAIGKTIVLAIARFDHGIETGQEHGVPRER